MEKSDDSSSSWCGAIHCKNSKHQNPEKSFHRFPIDPALSRQWVQFSRRQYLENKTTQYLHTNIKICSDHFEPSQYFPNSKRLMPTAVPAIFRIPNSPRPATTKRPLPDLTEPTAKKHRKQGEAGPSLDWTFIGDLLVATPNDEQDARLPPPVAAAAAAGDLTVVDEAQQSQEEEEGEVLSRPDSCHRSRDLRQRHLYRGLPDRSDLERRLPTAAMPGVSPGACGRLNSRPAALADPVLPRARDMQIRIQRLPPPVVAAAEAGNLTVVDEAKQPVVAAAAAAGNLTVVDEAQQPQEEEEVEFHRLPQSRSTQAVKRGVRFVRWSAVDLKRATDGVRHDHMSISMAARTFGIPRTTLRDLLVRKVPNPRGGRPARMQKTGPFTVFTERQEKLLTGHLRTLSKQFYGLTRNSFRKLLYEVAEHLKLKHSFNKETKMAGKYWLTCFLRRHRTLCLRRPQRTSLARMAGFRRADVERFFDNLRAAQVERYPLEDVYNVDETGITAVSRLVRDGQRAIGLTNSAERGQTTTAICCMSAAGAFHPPALVFTGKCVDPRMKRGAPPGTSFFASESGWSNATIFTEWMQHFAMRSGAGPKRPVLLILDNHESHVTLKTYNLAKEHNITLVSLPPHTSHKLQPLDVSFFGPLKSRYSAEVHKFMRQNPGQKVTQFEISDLFCKAYLPTASTENAVRGFEVTGILSLDPEVFGDEDFVAAESVLDWDEDFVAAESVLDWDEDFVAAESVLDNIEDRRDGSGPDERDIAPRASVSVFAEASAFGVTDRADPGTTSGGGASSAFDYADRADLGTTSVGAASAFDGADRADPGTISRGAASAFGGTDCADRGTTSGGGASSAFDGADRADPGTISGGAASAFDYADCADPGTTSGGAASAFGSTDRADYDVIVVIDPSCHPTRLPPPVVAAASAGDLSVVDEAQHPQEEEEEEVLSRPDSCHRSCDLRQRHLYRGLPDRSDLERRLPTVAMPGVSPGACGRLNSRPAALADPVLPRARDMQIRIQRLHPSVVAAAAAGDLSVVDEVQQPQEEEEEEEEVHSRPPSPPYDFPGFTQEDQYKSYDILGGTELLVHDGDTYAWEMNTNAWEMNTNVHTSRNAPPTPPPGVSLSDDPLDLTTDLEKLKVEAETAADVPGSVTRGLTMPVESIKEETVAITSSTSADDDPASVTPDLTMTVEIKEEELSAATSSSTDHEKTPDRVYNATRTLPLGNHEDEPRGRPPTRVTDKAPCASEEHPQAPAASGAPDSVWDAGQAAAQQGARGGATPCASEEPPQAPAASGAPDSVCDEGQAAAQIGARGGAGLPCTSRGPPQAPTARVNPMPRHPDVLDSGESDANELLRGEAYDILDDSWSDPDYTPGSDSDEYECPPSADLDELPRCSGPVSSSSGLIYVVSSGPASSSAAPVAAGTSGTLDDRTDALEAVTESAGPSGQIAAVTTSIRSTAAVSYQAATTTTNSRGRRKWDRKNMCLYCERPQAKLAKHLQLEHGTEVDVHMALLHPMASTERRKALSDLTKRGNYRHNMAVLSGEKKGELIACNRARATMSGNNFLACEACKGFFLRSSLWRHKRSCNPTGGGRVQANARAAMSSTGASSAKLRKVLDSMCIDNVSLLCKTDATILLFGEGLCAKLGGEIKDVQNVRSRMRELGRLLEVLRKIDPEANLKSFLVPGRFSELTAGACQMSGFSSETNKHVFPSVALRIGYSMKRCAEQVLALQIEGSQEMSQTRQFIELYNFQWTKQVSRHALGTLQEAKWNRVKMMPVAADIQLIHRFLDVETEKKTAELKSDPSQANYRNLAELVLTRIVMFNRRRRGEASAMTVDDAYQEVTSSNDMNYPEASSALSDFEKHLASSLLRVVVPGKKGGGVPLLLTHDMRASVDVLLECREAAGVGASQYVFVNYLSTGDRPLRVWDCLRKIARLSGIENPASVTSTKLRKHIGTLSQVLNLKDSELDLLATFLGHDIREHRRVYCMPEATTQLAVVSKLLLASEKTIGAWRGKSLDEIRIEDIPDVVDDSDADDADEMQIDDSDAHEVPTPTPDDEAVLRASIQRRAGGGEQDSDPRVATRSKGPPTSATNTTETRRAQRKRKLWTPEAKAAIDAHFTSFINHLLLPGKADCIRVLAAESALSGRSWTEIKNCVHNRIQKRKKLGRMPL